MEGDLKRGSGLGAPTLIGSTGIQHRGHGGHGVAQRGPDVECGIRGLERERKKELKYGSARRGTGISRSYGKFNTEDTEDTEGTESHRGDSLD